MNRLEKNLEVLDKLFYYLKENPTIRFGQALSNLNLATHRRDDATVLENTKTGWPLANYVDIFYEEPEQTLTKMREL